MHFLGILRASEQYVGEFTAQNLTNTAWAYVTARQLDILLFRAQARLGLRQGILRNSKTFLDKSQDFLGKWLEFVGLIIIWQYKAIIRL